MTWGWKFLKNALEGLLITLTNYNLCKKGVEVRRVKNIFGLILGTLIGWLLWGYFTSDFSAEKFVIFLIGIILGYLIGRRNPKEET